MLHYNFVRPMRKWRVDLWHLTTIKAIALLLRVSALVVVVPVINVVIVAFTAVNAMGVAAVVVVGLPGWE